MRLPRLAVFAEEHSASTMEIAEAARGWCEIVWVIGHRPGGGGGKDRRVLSRFGEIADIEGLLDEQVITCLQAFDFDGVVVFDDGHQVLAATVAERLDRRFHSRRTARLLTDKAAQRDALTAAGIPVPRHATIGPDHDGVPDISFPAVLKPRSGSGSRSLFLVEDAEQLQAALGRCADEELIVEEWLPDRAHNDRFGSNIVSVETSVDNGVVQHLAVMGRFPFDPPRESGVFMLSDLDGDDMVAVRDLAGAAASALGVRCGLLHTEIKLTPRGPRIIEVNGRLGGGVAALVTRLGGPSMHTWAMRLALSLEPGPAPVLDDSLVAFQFWVLPPDDATQVVAVSGVRALRGLKGVEKVLLNHRSGDSIDARGGFSSHALLVAGAVTSHAELAELYGRSLATVDITYV